jgi:hypothetical protein
MTDNYAFQKLAQRYLFIMILKTESSFFTKLSNNYVTKTPHKTMIVRRYKYYYYKFKISIPELLKQYFLLHLLEPS